MRIAEIMTSEVETIGPDALVEVAADRMANSRIHHLVVVEGSPRAPTIVGVLSSGDLIALRRAGVGKNPTVRELMSPDPICVTPGTPVRRAANLIRGRAVGSLPVIDGGRLVGIVTISDLLELLGRGVRRGPSGRVDHAPRRRSAALLRPGGPGRGV